MSATRGASELRRQAGQSMAEFVVCGLFLIPTFIAVILIPRYQLIDSKAAASGRYATWERTVWGEDEKSLDQLRAEADTRFFADRRAAASIPNVFDHPNSETLVTAVELADASAGELPATTLDPVTLVAGYAALRSPDQAAPPGAQDNAEQIARELAGCYAVQAALQAIAFALPPLAPVVLSMMPPGYCETVAAYTASLTTDLDTALPTAIEPLAQFDPFGGADATAPLTTFIGALQPVFDAIDQARAIQEQIPTAASLAQPCPYTLLVPLPPAGLPASIAKFYVPNGVANEMQLEPNGLYGVTATASARQLVGPETNDLAYRARGAILTDTWTPASDEDYQARVARSVVYERYLVQVATAPAKIFANIGFATPDLLPAPAPTLVPGVQFTPFGNGCNAQYVEAPVQRDALPWSVGRVPGSMGTDPLVGDLAHWEQQTGGMALPPPLIIDHDGATDLGGGAP